MKNKVKILVVDDDEIFQSLVRHGLEEKGFITDGASDGDEAIKKVLDFQPDIILLDVNMPKKSGFDVLKEIKGKQKIYLYLFPITFLP